MNNNRSYDAMKITLSSIGKVYRDSRRRMDLYEIEHIVQKNRRQYENDAAYVRYIDRVLKDCDEQTRFIIRNEYLNVNEPNWYLPYYTQQTYYRRKRMAVEQFDRTLNY